MASGTLTRHERARRYLQASMAAGYTGLSAEHRRAYLEQLAGHERAYAGVKRHAIAGSRRHFDKPLSSGEREHQTHLRDREGFTEATLSRTQRELDGELAGARADRRARARDEQRSEQLAGPRAARAGAGAAAAGLGLSGGGNTLLYLVGVMLGLSLVYLLVAGKGGNAIGGLVGIVTGGVRAFVAPVDPIKVAESALGAGPIAASSAPIGASPPPSSAGQAIAGGGALPHTGARFELRRRDQGRDVQLAPGALIGSPGDFEVEAIKSDPAGFGPDYPIVRELTGPLAGKELYAGHVDAILPAGHKRYRAGTAFARTSRTGHNAPPGWLEWGFAPGGSPGPMGQRTPF